MIAGCLYPHRASRHLWIADDVGRGAGGAQFVPGGGGVDPGHGLSHRLMVQGDGNGDLQDRRPVAGLARVRG